MSYPISDELRKWREQRATYTVGKKLATVEPVPAPKRKAKRKKATDE